MAWPRMSSEMIMHSTAGSSPDNGRCSKRKFEAAVRHAISLLLAEPQPSPTIVAVADQLSMNVRTLQRRLESVGIPFRELLSDCRQRLARGELSGSDDPIAELSIRLGYSDPAHFARAFRRWTGSSPVEYRRALQLKKRPR